MRGGAPLAAGGAPATPWLASGSAFTCASSAAAAAAAASGSNSAAGMGAGNCGSTAGWCHFRGRSTARREQGEANNQRQGPPSWAHLAQHVPYVCLHALLLLAVGGGQHARHVPPRRQLPLQRALLLLRPRGCSGRCREAGPAGRVRACTGHEQVPATTCWAHGGPEGGADPARQPLHLPCDSGARSRCMSRNAVFRLNMQRCCGGGARGER